MCVSGRVHKKDGETAGAMNRSMGALRFMYWVKTIWGFPEMGEPLKIVGFC